MRVFKAGSEFMFPTAPLALWFSMKFTNIFKSHNLKPSQSSPFTYSPSVWSIFPSLPIPSFTGLSVITASNPLASNGFYLSWNCSTKPSINAGSAQSPFYLTLFWCLTCFTIPSLKLPPPLASLTLLSPGFLPPLRLLNFNLLHWFSLIYLYLKFWPSQSPCLATSNVSVHLPMHPMKTYRNESDKVTALTELTA